MNATPDTPNGLSVAGAPCDRCARPAVALTLHEAGPLTWCALHLRVHRRGLLAAASVLIEHRVAPAGVPHQRSGIAA